MVVTVICFPVAESRVSPSSTRAVSWCVQPASPFSLHPFQSKRRFHRPSQDCPVLPSSVPSSSFPTLVHCEGVRLTRFRRPVSVPYPTACSAPLTRRPLLNKAPNNLNRRQPIKSTGLLFVLSLHNCRLTPPVSILQQLRGDIRIQQL